MLTVVLGQRQSTNTIVTITSSDNNIASAPASVTIAAGQTSNSFSVRGNGGGVAVILATLPAALGGNAAQATVTVNKLATTTTLSSLPNPSGAGQPVTLTATVRNANSPVLSGRVTFKDGVTALGADFLDQAGQAVLATSLPTAGTRSITAEYEGTNAFAASVSAPLSQTVNVPADLAVTQTASADPAQPGSPLTFTATIRNNGPLAATGVAANVTLPPGVAFSSATTTQGNCSRAGDTVNCNIGSLANGATATLIVAVVPTKGVITNTVSVRAEQTDSLTANNTSVRSVRINDGVKTARDSKGTEFWLAFLQNLRPNELSLFITSETDTMGTVSVPGLGFSAPFSVRARTVTTVRLPAEATLRVSDRVGNLGVHVTALDEVTVYGLNRLQFTTDAYLGLPTDILGVEYLVLTYRGGGPEFAVVGTADNTTVTITPTEQGARPRGVPYQIRLNRGETYQLVLGTDLSGSVITADKPVAVFGGNVCTNVPPEFFACDHLTEQLPPVETWGRSFLTAPLATRKKGDTFRFLAARDATRVSVNGTPVVTLNRGQVFEQLIEGPAQITADQPILVAQFSNGSQFDGVTSDPFMMLIPPFEQFLASYTVTTPASGFGANFINVVTPQGAAGRISLDGAPIPADRFTPIGASGFAGAQLPVSLGSHNLSGPLPFGVFVYGFDEFDSYGYPGGLSLDPIGRVTTVALAPKTAMNRVGARHCVSAAVTDQNRAPVSGVRVDFSVTGANPAEGFANADDSGRAQFCYVGTTAGEDAIRAAVGSISDSATSQWIQCDPQAKLALPAGKSGFDFGAVAAGRELNPNPPSDTFTVENVGCAPLLLSFAVKRLGPDATNGRISNPDDSASFPLKIIMDGAETPLPVSPGSPPIQIPNGQSRGFRVQFNPLIPILAGKTTELFANQVMPDLINSQLVITPNAGAPLTVNLTGRISPPAKMIHPSDSRLEPLVVFTRVGDEFTIECSTHDSNLDLQLARYQFLDQNDRRVGVVAEVGLAQAIAQRDLVRGQSFSIIQKFTGAAQRPEINKVQVTLLDGETFVTAAPAVLGVVEQQLASVSAASFLTAALAGESMVSSFGSGLAAGSQTAAATPLPTSLSGVTVRVRDGAGVERASPLFFVSPGQINFQIPAGTMVGAATVSVVRENRTAARGVVQIANAAPGLFAANANGQGAAAAVALRVRANGAQQFEPVAQFDSAQNRFVTRPLDLGSSTDNLYLALFGTGIRFRRSTAPAVVRIGGIESQAIYAGAQGGFVGLDQVNVLVPRALAGRGEVDVTVTVDGRTSNPVRVRIGGSAAAVAATQAELASDYEMGLRAPSRQTTTRILLPALRLPSLNAATQRGSGETKEK